MKRKRIIAIIAAMLILSTAITPTLASFNDGENYPAMEAAAELGLIKGYEDGSFRPHQPITRAEAAAVLYRAFATDEDYNYNFGDKWWSKPVGWLWFCTIAANQYGSAIEQIEQTFYDGANGFNPNKPASAGFIVLMAYAVFQTNETGSFIESVDFCGDAAEWYAERGGGPYVFEMPTITRAEACELILQLCELS